ncbi:MgtC/SapB family protein [candidate division WOR-3 bacterium]|nr:MgtC/SapB family protein [candidate division WOR-3 bacterium]
MICLIDLLDALWRLGLVLVLSAVVGLERSLADKPAGIRTHILVGFGSALFMIVAEFGGLDAGRAAAGVITGIGFLGAGTIIRERGTVRGLTTAASIWVVAGIGMAAARKLWLLAIIATVGVVVVLRGFDLLEKALERLWERRKKEKS